MAKQRSLAVLFVAALLAAACGGDGDIAAEDPIIVIAESTAEDSLADDEPLYGATVEEFTSTIDASPAGSDPVAADAEPPPGYINIEWDELVAPGFSNDEIWARYAEELNAVEPGSAEANVIYDKMQAESLDAASSNSDMDGQKIQLAGFVAPLSYEGEDITEFLLVPFFGACIHVPPPPANQTIMVALDEGMDFDDSYGIVLVTGTMSLDLVETGIGTASYSLTNAAYRVASY